MMIKQAIMQLNTLRPAAGAKKTAKRLGRGIGSGLGKTSGKGHKGQTARSGGFHKVGFEGGQTPLQRRLPKMGFRSRMSKFSAEIRLFELDNIEFENNYIHLASLRDARLIDAEARTIKIILKGKIQKALVIANHIKLSKGAKEAILAAGGKIEESDA